MEAKLFMHSTTRSSSGATLRHGATLILRGDGFASSAERAERIARAIAPETWPREYGFGLNRQRLDETAREAVWTVSVEVPTSD